MFLTTLVSPWLLLAVPVFFYLLPYLRNWQIRKFPGPFPAQFTNLWLLSVCRRGKRYWIVDQVHKKLGPVVRIQPNHVSIADDEAIQLIYGHGNGLPKSLKFPTYKVAQC